MASRKAQVSIEYLLIVGFLLLAIIPVFQLAMREYTTSVASSQVDNAVRALVQTADQAYLTGPGTRKLVWITLPGGVAATDVSGRHVAINVSIRGKSTEVHRLSQANLTGSVPAEQGTFPMAVETLDSNIVLINRTS